ncbi:hypothetical protein [Streptomyces sp. H27-G5]|uniref:hypothetical protein n=1 Tax=Streptomyces sp. H27-G5 TaxID=2996698 RepID=UPI00227039D2|nr:hypothetical protein [Streptomyces sp. H27-G5]
MAGESPDKSVDEGASGAADTAASSAERDPRLSVLRPREPESGDRDPLKVAVAAWVASASADTERTALADGDGAGAGQGDGGDGGARSRAGAGADAAGGGAEVEAEAGTGAGAEVVEATPESKASSGRVDSSATTGSADAATGSDSGAKSGSGAGSDSGSGSGSGSASESASASGSRSGSGSASGSDGAARGSVAAGKPAAADQRTTAFGVVKPAPDASAEQSTEVEGPADSERTAVFRAFRNDAREAPKTQPKPEPTSESKPESRPEPRPASRPASESKPGSGSDSGSGSATGRGAAVDPRSGSASGAPAKPSEDSERTAVFRAVQPGAAPAGPAAPSAPKPPQGDRPAPPKPSEDSERTAVFRAVQPGAAEASKPGAGSGSGSGAPPKPSEDSERTAVFRAVKPGAAPAGPAAPSAPKPPQGDRPAPPHTAGGERASTFVPLRGDNARPAAPTAPKQAPTAPAPAPKQAPAPAGLRQDSERTTQQPLPPKPPLDMLADLTNNPPPPPSPLRTFARRFKIYAPLVALLVIILAVVQLVRPLPEPQLKMTAQGSFTFDGSAPVLPWPKEGQGYMAAAGLGTVGTFGEQKPIAIGSVAKTMTAYVILKDHPMKKGEKGQMIPVDKTAVDDGKKDSEGESTVNTLKEGGQISEYDALAAIMIPSANNIARLLARWDSGGDQEAFVKKMNDTAKELGMTNTTYTDPSGLDATTVSTAEDQVKLGLKVVEMPELIAITKLPKWTDPSGKTWRNYNDLIPYNDSLGIKTGSTTKAGGNLLFAAQKQVGKTNQLIVGAVLGQHGVPILDTAIAASKDVMLATQKTLTGANVVKKGQVVGYVDDGLGGRTPVVATADVEAVGWPSLKVNVKLGEGGGPLPQTAKAGTEIGVLTIGEGASQVKVPVALKQDLVSPSLGSKLTRVG